MASGAPIDRGIRSSGNYDVEAFGRRLREVLPRERVSRDLADRVCHGYDSSFETAWPDWVAWPRDAEEVAACLRAAHELGVPVFPRGAGTGLAGGAVPAGGGLVLVLTGLDRIGGIDRSNGLVEVGAGAITARVQQAVRAVGLFYPPDPSSAATSTIGGNVATGAGGPRSFKYGTTRDHLAGLEVVLADGTLLRTGGRTAKSSTGYDLTRLLAGSEGTLGVITAATLRLRPSPPEVRTAVGVFAELGAAGRALVRLATEREAAAVELIDRLSLRIVEEFLHLGLPVHSAAVLLVEVDGWPEEVAAALPRVLAALREEGGEEVREAGAEAAALWRARKSISAAVARLRPTKIAEDVVVPRTQVPAMLERIAGIAERHRVILPVFGHAGDGNLHPNILCDRRNPEEMARVERAIAELFEAAVELGGTLSGEHGVGSLKAPYLAGAVGEAAWGVMRRIKETLDPAGILNPGKLFRPAGAYHG